MGGVIRGIGRVVRAIGSGSAGKILRGVSKAAKQGISGLLSSTRTYGNLAQNVLGKLGGLGIGGLARPPMQPGYCAFPYSPVGKGGGGGVGPLPGPGAGPIGAGGAGGGGALGQAQAKFDSAMGQLTSGKKLDQATMMKLQQQIQEANRMFEMINSIQKSIHDSLKGMIRNIQA